MRGSPWGPREGFGGSSLPASMLLLSEPPRNPHPQAAGGILAAPQARTPELPPGEGACFLECHHMHMGVLGDSGSHRGPDRDACRHKRCDTPGTQTSCRAGLGVVGLGPQTPGRPESHRHCHLWGGSPRWPCALRKAPRVQSCTRGPPQNPQRKAEGARLPLLPALGGTAVSVLDARQRQTRRCSPHPGYEPASSQHL